MTWLVPFPQPIPAQPTRLIFPSFLLITNNPHGGIANPSRASNAGLTVSRKLPDSTRMLPSWRQIWHVTARLQENGGTGEGGPVSVALPHELGLD